MMMKSNRGAPNYGTLDVESMGLWAFMMALVCLSGFLPISCVLSWVHQREKKAMLDPSTRYADL